MEEAGQKYEKQVEKYKYNLYGQHPIWGSYIGCAVILTLSNLIGVKGILAYYINSVLISVILFAGNTTARLSQKKVNLTKKINDELFKIDYSHFDTPYSMDNDDLNNFSVAIFVNDFVIAIFVLISWSGKSFFIAFLLALVILSSFYDFGNVDEEYNQLVKIKSDMKTLKLQHQQKLVEAAKEYEEERRLEEHLDGVDFLKKEIDEDTKYFASHPAVERSPKPRTHSQSYFFHVAGTTHYNLKKAIRYARTHDLIPFPYEGETVQSIKEDYVYGDKVYETDLRDAISAITLTPDPDNKYDGEAIKVTISVGSQEFMIGYVPASYTEHVHSTLKHLKNKTQTAKVTGHAIGGRYKYLDDEDHVRTASSNPGFIVNIEVEDIK